MVDPVVAEVAAMLARLSALTVEPAPGADADRIDRIAAYERMRGALAAAQQAEMVAFARSQVEQHIADDRFDPAAVGRGIGDQIGLACRVSDTTMAAVSWLIRPVASRSRTPGRSKCRARAMPRRREPWNGETRQASPI